MWKEYCDLITEKKIKNEYNNKELRNNIPKKLEMQYGKRKD